MPIGFQRAKKRHNRKKRLENKQERRQIQADVQQLIDGKPIKYRPTFDSKQGGLSRSKSQASHRKQTTRQINENDHITKYELPSYLIDNCTV